MGGFKQSLSDDEKRALSNLEAALKPFFKLNPTMPLQYITAFLLVALKEGQTVRELAHRAGISDSLMSRHLNDLSQRNRYHEEGYDLVVGTDDPMDRRTSRKRLTDKGQRMVGQMLGALAR
jgi:DNA-binding MarR family transcriptional regulator